MLHISSIEYSYSKKAIIGGIIYIDPKYSGRLLQLNLNGFWNDLGRVLRNGSCSIGVEKPFHIKEPQYVDIRIWNGPDLGSIYLEW